MTDMSFIDWLAYGVRKDWISDPVCVTHEGIPNTEEEYKQQEEGKDPCRNILRLWP